MAQPAIGFKRTRKLGTSMDFPTDASTSHGFLGANRMILNATQAYLTHQLHVLTGNPHVLMHALTTERMANGWPGKALQATLGSQQLQEAQ
eukprot:639767-Karenia_brevis.AAC.1